MTLHRPNAPTRAMDFLLNIVVFWLLATRLTGFFLLAPGVQDLQVPKLVRVAVIVWLACFMTPLVGARSPSSSTGPACSARWPWNSSSASASGSPRGWCSARCRPAAR
ncbi:MAG: hypothetical protein WDO13_05900 [Verrucomicrobiota bacterium]